MGKALVILSRLTRPTNGVCVGAAAVTQSRPSGRAIVQHLIHKEDQRAADCCFLFWDEFSNSLCNRCNYVCCLYLSKRRKKDGSDRCRSIFRE